jgi:hypothetical protein
LSKTLNIADDNMSFVIKPNDDFKSAFETGIWTTSTSARYERWLAWTESIVMSKDAPDDSADRCT